MKAILIILISFSILFNAVLTCSNPYSCYIAKCDEAQAAIPEINIQPSSCRTCAESAPEPEPISCCAESVDIKPIAECKSEETNSCCYIKFYRNLSAIFEQFNNFSNYVSLIYSPAVNLSNLSATKNQDNLISIPHRIHPLIKTTVLRI